MIETLNAIDKNLFLILNELHARWLDSIMWFITGRSEWIPFYLLIALYLFKKYGWYAFAVLAAVGVTVLLTDQFSSGFCKPFFARLRPSHNPDIMDSIHIINNYRGGLYGFISSHACNAFGIATFLHLLLKKDNRYSFLLLFWAALVSYSRIYVGVHYPGDILAGGISGALIGILVYHSFKKAMMNTSARRLLLGSY